MATRHRGILVYDPQTQELKTLVYTYRNQLFKGPNDLDFDAEGNLFFTDPWGTGPGPNLTDQTGAVYQYARDGMLRKVMDSGLFPNGIAVSPDNTRARGRRFSRRPDLVQHVPKRSDDGLPAMPEGSVALDLQFGEGRDLSPRKWRAGRHALRRARPFMGGSSRSRRHCPNQPAWPHSRVCADPQRCAATTNFAFGGPDNQYIYLMGASTGTFWRFKAPIPADRSGGACACRRNARRVRAGSGGSGATVVQGWETCWGCVGGRYPWEDGSEGHTWPRTASASRGRLRR